MRVPFLAGSPAAAPSGGRHAEIKHPLPVLSPDRGCFIHIQSSEFRPQAPPQQGHSALPGIGAFVQDVVYRHAYRQLHAVLSRSTISASTV